MDNANNAANTVPAAAAEFVEKVYTHAGTSFYNDETTFRFAGDDVKGRTAILRRGGHTDIEFRKLPRPMVLKDAMAFLVANGVQAVLPSGQRKGQNGKLPVVQGEQQDEHVKAHDAAMAAAAEAEAKAQAKRDAANARKRELRAAAKAKKAAAEG